MRDRLYAIASKVRKALESPSVGTSAFPWQACQFASKLLGKYLVEEEGIAPVFGVANGTRYFPRDGYPEWPIEQSHFWLEHAGIIIDITADQFDECDEPVIVTVDRSWHDQYTGQTRLTQDVLLDLNDYLLEHYDKMLKALAVDGACRDTAVH